MLIWQNLNKQLCGVKTSLKKLMKKSSLTVSNECKNVLVRSVALYGFLNQNGNGIGYLFTKISLVNATDKKQLYVPSSRARRMTFSSKNRGEIPQNTIFIIIQGIIEKFLTELTIMTGLSYEY